MGLEAPLIAAAGLVVVGVLVLTVTRSAAAGGLDRDSAIGIRTKATLASDLAWEAGHRAAAPYALAAAATSIGTASVGVVTAVAGVALGEPPVIVAAGLVVLGGYVVLIATLALAARVAGIAARRSG